MGLQKKNSAVVCRKNCVVSRRTYWCNYWFGLSGRSNQMVVKYPEAHVCFCVGVAEHNDANDAQSETVSCKVALCNGGRV